MVAVLGEEKVLANVESNEGDGGNAEARQSALESVNSGEGALCSPSLSVNHVRAILEKEKSSLPSGPRILKWFSHCNICVVLESKESKR